MPKAKSMKQEELRQVIGQNLAPIRATGQSLADLIQMFARGADFSFSELECANKALDSIDEAKGALKEIKAAMATRARTRVAEACK